MPDIAGDQARVMRERRATLIVSVTLMLLVGLMLFGVIAFLSAGSDPHLIDALPIIGLVTGLVLAGIGERAVRSGRSALSWLLAAWALVVLTGIGAIAVTLMF
jgi:hypothetical protein